MSSVGGVEVGWAWGGRGVVHDHQARDSQKLRGQERQRKRGKAGRRRRRIKRNKKKKRKEAAVKTNKASLNPFEKAHERQVTPIITSNPSVTPTGVTSNGQPSYHNWSSQQFTSSSSPHEVEGGLVPHPATATTTTTHANTANAASPASSLAGSAEGRFRGFEWTPPGIPLSSPSSSPVAAFDVPKVATRAGTGTGTGTGVEIEVETGVGTHTGTRTRTAMGTGVDTGGRRGTGKNGPATTHYIPNIRVPASFLNRVVLGENASVIRVVWFVLHTALSGQPSVEVSYDELQKALDLSRTAVADGLKRALEAGYIKRVVTPPSPCTNSTDHTRKTPLRLKATYAVVWQNPPAPTPPPSPAPPSTTPPGTKLDHARGDAAGTGPSAGTGFGSDLTRPAKMKETKKSPDPARQAAPPLHKTTSQSQSGVLESVAAASGEWSDLRTDNLPTARSDFQTESGAGDSNLELLLVLESFPIQPVPVPVPELELELELESLDQEVVGYSDHFTATSTTSTATSTSKGVGSLTTSDPSDLASWPTLQKKPWPTKTEPDAQAKADRKPKTKPRAEGKPLPSPQTRIRAKASTYLTNLSLAFSRELGDEIHAASNRTQVLNLWQASGLPQEEFAALLYRSRELTRRYATLRPGEELPPDRQPRNRMAYFFTVVREELRVATAKCDDGGTRTDRGRSGAPDATDRPFVIRAVTTTRAAATPDRLTQAGERVQEEEGKWGWYGDGDRAGAVEGFYPPPLPLPPLSSTTRMRTRPTTTTTTMNGRGSRPYPYPSPGHGSGPSSSPDYNPGWGRSTVSRSPQAATATTGSAPARSYDCGTGFKMPQSWLQFARPEVGTSTSASAGVGADGS